MKRIPLKAPIKAALRDHAEEAELLAEFADRRRDRPEAGLVAGTLDIDDNRTYIAVGSAGFTIVHRVALADACLEHAGKHLAEQAAADPELLDLLKLVERARAELDFEAPSRSAQ